LLWIRDLECAKEFDRALSLLVATESELEP
jgi:hypothetical protein